MRDYTPPQDGHDALLVDNARFIIVRTDSYALSQIEGPVAGGVLRSGIQLIGWGDGTYAMVLSEPHRENAS